MLYCWFSYHTLWLWYHGWSSLLKSTFYLRQHLSYTLLLYCPRGLTVFVHACVKAYNKVLLAHHTLAMNTAEAEHQCLHTTPPLPIQTLDIL